MPTIDNWRALREALEAGPTQGPFYADEARADLHAVRVRLPMMVGSIFADVGYSGSTKQDTINAEYIAAAHPAAIRSLLDERDRLEKALALVQQHHATAWNRGHTIGMAEQEETARKALEAVKADAWGNAQLTEALLAAESDRDRLTAEQQVLREWISEALPVLASIDDCEDMEPIRALLESGRKLVEGGPDDLLAGV